MQDDLVPIELVTGFSPVPHSHPNSILPPFGHKSVDVAFANSVRLRGFADRLVGYAPDPHAHS